MAERQEVRIGGLFYPRTLVEEWQRAVRAVIGLNISEDVEVDPWAMQIVNKLLTSLDMALTAALDECSRRSGVYEDDGRD